MAQRKLTCPNERVTNMSEGVHSTLTEKKRDGLIIIIIGGFNFTVIQINPLVPVVDISTTFILVFYKLLKYLKAPQRLYLFTR